MGWAVVSFVLGAALAALVCLHVVRRRRRSESDQRVAELSELAGGLAHEVRNPLSTLMVNLQLLGEDLRELDGDDADSSDSNQANVRRRCLLKIDAVQREAERLQHLLEEFLRLAGPCRLDLRRVDLNGVVEHLVEFFSPQADTAGVRLRTAYHAQPLFCLLDGRMIEQAILNMLINAQEAMPDGGEIMVRTILSDARTAGVEISDTGGGIPAGIQAKVFNPFYSTKARGTGLGLSTTRRIVLAHGGSLKLHSEPGRGTCFSLRFPLAGGDG